MRPYRNYKNGPEGAFPPLPQHWDARRAKSFYRESDQRSHSGTEELMSVSHITGVTPRKEYVTMFLADSTEGYKICEPGDIVINTMWAYMAALGVSRQTGIVSPSYGVYKPRTADQLDPGYVDMLLRTELYRTQYNYRSTGITSSRLRLYADEFLAIPIISPPLSEQQAIVRYLYHIDDLINRYISAKERLITLLEEQRQAETSIAIADPQTKWTRLKTAVHAVSRPITRTATKEYNPIGLLNRGRGIFIKETLKGNELGDSEFFWIEEGDLIISGQFAWEGAVALAYSEHSGCVASHRFPIIRGKPGMIKTEFLLALLRTDYGQMLLDVNSRGAAGRNRPLNSGALLKEAIPVPPTAAQSKIMELVHTEQQLRVQTKQSRELLDQYRTRLITDVVTGQIDVRDSSINWPD